MMVGGASTRDHGAAVVRVNVAVIDVPRTVEGGPAEERGDGV